MRGAIASVFLDLCEAWLGSVLLRIRPARPARDVEACLVWAGGVFRRDERAQVLEPVLQACADSQASKTYMNKNHVTFY